MGATPRIPVVLARCSAAVLGGAIFGLGAAAFEARSATTELGFIPRFVVTAGLLAPLVLAMGLCVGALRVLFVPSDLGGYLLEYLTPEDGTTRRSRSLALFLTPFALLLFVIVSARWALYVLASGLPASASGAALALALLLLGGVLTFAVTLTVRVVGARSEAAKGPGIAPAVSLASALALVGLTFCLLVAFGETSGGSSVWSQFGVLRREGVNFKPLGLLAGIAFGAALLPRLRSYSTILVACFVGVAPLGLSVVAARSGLKAPGLALAIERRAPLSALVLERARTFFDRDRDGFSALFAGGDCDDNDPARNPDAFDVPGNAIDEDCSGEDAVAAPVIEAPPKVEALTILPKDLSVLLITIDTLRWDVGYAGNPRGITPRIDELAKESVVFERAYSLASYTAKSLPPMLIGKYSSETHRGYAHFNRFGKSETFLAERLQRAGIHTMSVQGFWYFFQAPYGMERGFDVIDSSAAPRTPQLEGDRGSTSERLSEAAIGVLRSEETRNRRFFTWIHYTDPHAEYVPHEGFTAGRNGRALYEGEVSFVDFHIGRVLDALRQGPLAARTAVILTSDHGEAFGEHGLYRHGFELWEELVRVPLLIRVPGIPPRGVKEPRSLIDLVPTILELYALPVPNGEAGDFVSGHSLVADLTGEATPRPIFIDMAEGPYNEERRAYIEQDLKLVTRKGVPLSLYDLAQDPNETNDLSRDRERARTALDRYKAFRSTLREVKVEKATPLKAQ